MKEDEKLENDTISARQDNHGNVIATVTAENIGHEQQEDITDALSKLSSNLLQKNINRDSAGAMTHSASLASKIKPALIIDLRNVEADTTEFAITPILNFLGKKANANTEVVVLAQEGQQVMGLLQDRVRNEIQPKLKVSRGTPEEASTSLAAGRDGGAIYKC